ncbi:hypothetical protein ACFW9N_22255 [Streptomyces sp. NPDC059496]|uniref:hypothetical protein n=1 Tax=Streptomyces sp. NPDC059496 TaxID=3346851 RepID=UPI0036CA0A49
MFGQSHPLMPGWPGNIPLQSPKRIVSLWELSSSHFWRSFCGPLLLVVVEQDPASAMITAKVAMSPHPIAIGDGPASVAAAGRFGVWAGKSCARGEAVLCAESARVL